MDALKNSVFLKIHVMRITTAKKCVKDSLWIVMSVSVLLVHLDFI